MIELKFETTRFKVQPQNAETYRLALAKPKKHKPEALTSVNLKREYPIFKPGMKTSDYVNDFAALNARCMLIGLDYTYTDRVAPMLDAAYPEVVESVNDEYVPDFLSTPTSKAKKQTVATLRQSIQSALTLMQAGDVDMAQCILNEAIK